MSPPKIWKKKEESSQRRLPIYILRWTDDTRAVETHTHSIWLSWLPGGLCTSFEITSNLKKCHSIYKTCSGHDSPTSFGTKQQPSWKDRLRHTHKEKKLKCKCPCVGVCEIVCSILPDQMLLAGGHLCPIPDCLWQHALTHKTQLKVRIKSFNHT